MKKGDTVVYTDGFTAPVSNSPTKFTIKDIVWDYYGCSHGYSLDYWESNKPFIVITPVPYFDNGIYAANKFKVV